MQDIKGASGRKWMTLPAMITIVALLSAFFGGSSSDTTETIYRENTVVRGDITVGVSESASATLKTHTVSFDVGAEVASVHVKAGQKVEAGDVLVVLNTEAITEALNDIRADYQEALYELSEAELKKQTSELDALTTYQNSLLNAEFAQQTYEMTILQLEEAITDAKDKLYDIQTEIRTYNRLLRYVDSYTYAQDQVENATNQYNIAYQAWVKSSADVTAFKKEMQEKYGTSSTVDWTADELSRLADLESYVDTDYQEMSKWKLEMEDLGDEYNGKYDSDYQDEDDIKTALKDTYVKLESAENAVKRAEYNLEIGKKQAELTLQSTLAKAEMAEETYELSLTQYANNITSKQQLVDNHLEQISKYNNYLLSATLTSPCNGTVTAVNVEAGDEFNGGSTLVTLSDSENVYVYMSVSQDDVTSISLGQACTVELDAFETVAFEAVVDSITTSPMRSASGSATYNVTIQLQGDTSEIFEGMTGTCTIVTRQQRDVLQVSYRSVYSGSDGLSYVKVKDEDGNITEVQVETGFSDGRNVEIVSGLSEGDVVIIESQVNL